MQKFNTLVFIAICFLMISQLGYAGGDVSVPVEKNRVASTQEYPIDLISKIITTNYWLTQAYLMEMKYTRPLTQADIEIKKGRNQSPVHGKLPIQDKCFKKNTKNLFKIQR